jgi:hypothetical protein
MDIGGRLIWKCAPAGPAETSLLTIALLVSISRGKLLRKSFNRQRPQSVHLKRFALDHDSGDANAIKNLIREPYTVALSEDKIDLSSLVGNKQQRATGGGAQLGAESMIVRMGVTAQVTICVGDFTSKAHSPSRSCLSSQQLDVPLLRHFLRFRQVGDESLDLRERHIIQPVPISELESTQCQSRDSAQ